MQIIRDPLWQFIGVVITLIALFLSILFFLKQRSKKEILYNITSNTPILSVEEEVKGKVKVLLEGKEVNDAHLIIIEVWNSGNSSILSTDYEKPIRIDFGDQAEIIDVTVLETKPDELAKEITLEKDLTSFSLKPTLLNSKDTIKLKILVTNSSDDISISARIAGITKILRPDQLPNTKLRKISGFVMKPLIVAIFYTLVLYFLFTFVIITNTPIESYKQYVKSQQDAAHIVQNPLILILTFVGSFMLLIILSTYKKISKKIKQIVVRKIDSN